MMVLTMMLTQMRMAFKMAGFNGLLRKVAKKADPVTIGTSDDS